MNFGGDHPAPGHGKISPRCVPEGASDGKSAGSWQYIAAMYSNTANFGKICVLCIQKAPQSAVGECTARTSCRQGAFSPSEALESCTAHKSCHPLMDLALAQGLLPEQLHRGIAFQRLGPCPGVPAPAPRRDPPPANACRLPCPLQSGASRRWASVAIIRRMACSPAKPRGTADYIISTVRPITGCCAELGLDSRTVDKWAQNLRRRPQARPGLRQRCQNAHRKDESLLAAPHRGCFAFLLYASRKARYPRYASKISALEVTSHGACIESTATPESMTSMPYFAGM